MPLQKLIIHELKKNQGSNEVELAISNKVIPLNAESQSLIEALQNSYSGGAIFCAEFLKSGGHFFPERFTKYQKSKRDDQSFIDFTIDSLNNLKKIISVKTFATGGYLLFVEYTQERISYIGIFLLRDTKGKIIRRVPDSFEIKTIDLVDTGHLAMACRIDENKLDSGEQHYLSFTRQRQPEISDYFTDWICANRLESNAIFTNSLYKIISSLDRPIDPETKKQYTIDEVRQMVYNNAQSNAQRNIDIRALSQQIYGDPSMIASYAENNRISIDTEFRYDKSALKKFIRIEAKADGVDLIFPRGDFNIKVRFSEENPNIVLIESEKFSKALRAQVENA
jgi:nucleoid-associated protein